MQKVILLLSLCVLLTHNSLWGVFSCMKSSIQKIVSIESLSNELFQAIRRNQPIKSIIEKCKDNQRYKLLSHYNLRENTILHEIMKTDNPVNTFNILLEHCPEENILDFLCLPSTQGNTIFHLAASYENSDLIERIMQVLSEKNNYDLIFKRNNTNHSALHLIAKIEYPTQQNNNALNAQINLIRTIITIVENSNNIHIIDELRCLFSELINSNSLFHWAATHGCYEIVAFIVEPVINNNNEIELT